MKTDKTHFEQDERGIAIEEAHDRGSQFYENLDGTIYVPKKSKEHDYKKKEEKKEETQELVWNC